MKNNSMNLANFGEDFQLSLIKLFLEDLQLFKSVYDVLMPEYFAIAPIQLIYSAMVEYFHKHKNQVPTFEMLKTYIMTQPSMMDDDATKAIVEMTLFKIMKKSVNRDRDYITQEILKFCKKSAVINAIEQSVRIAEYADKEEDYDAILGEFKKATQVGWKDIGINYIEDFEERYDPNNFSARKNVIPTGLSVLDKFIDGGLAVGELGVIGAFTGTGKTSLMIQIASNAVKAGHTVVHYTFENAARLISRKYDCCISGIVWDDLVAQKDKVKDAIDRVFPGQLIIQEYPIRRKTLTTLESHMNSLRDRDIVPDLVIIDYVDCLVSREIFKERRDALANLYEDVRGFSNEFHVPVWTATQFNRQSWDDDVADINRISESLGKAMASDLILTLNRKKAEKDLGHGRLYIAKSRLGIDSVTIPLHIDLARMSFLEAPEAASVVQQYYN